MIKISKILILTFILACLTNISYAERDIASVIKKDSVLAVYIKAGYLYNLFTENIINALKSNDTRKQNEVLRNLARQNLFGISNTSNVENAIKYIQQNNFLPTGNLIFSINPQLDGTAYMDVKCDPYELPEYIEDLLEERKIKTKTINGEMYLSTPKSEQTGLLTSKKLIIGNLSKDTDLEKGWQFFENSASASNTILVIEANITKIKNTIYKSIEQTNNNDSLFQDLHKYLSNIARLRIIGNTNKLQAMICVNDEKTREEFKNILKKELENIKNIKNEMRPHENGPRPPWFREDTPDPRDLYIQENEPNKNRRPPRPPRHPNGPPTPNIQKIKDFASKITIIDKSPWLGIEIPDFVNTIINDPEMLKILAGPPRR